jgi:hypothetical protein
MLDWKSNILSPVLVAVFLGVGTLLYNKLEQKTTEFETLVNKHPEVLEDLNNLSSIKDDMQKEYKYFKAKTNKRLGKLENKPAISLTPIYKRLSIDSSNVEIAFKRLDFLKSLH